MVLMGPKFTLHQMVSKPAGGQWCESASYSSCMGPRLNQWCVTGVYTVRHACWSWIGFTRASMVD